MRIAKNAEYLLFRSDQKRGVSLKAWFHLILRVADKPTPRESTLPVSLCDLLVPPLARARIRVFLCVVIANAVTDQSFP